MMKRPGIDWHLQHLSQWMLLHEKDLEQAISSLNGRNPDVMSAKSQLRISIIGIKATMDVINSLERATQEGNQS